MIIGIGGVSRSGKSFLAKALQNKFNLAGKTVEILDQDDYVLPTKDIPLIRDHVDWEIPESIDWKTFKEAIYTAKKRCDVVIAEGLLVFWDKSILAQFDKKILIELPKEEFVNRKRVDLRWGKEPEWYIQYIWDSFLKYGGLPDETDPDIILDGGKAFDISKIMNVLRRYYV